MLNLYLPPNSEDGKGYILARSIVGPIVDGVQQELSWE
jgi:hypothetical protein